MIKVRRDGKDIFTAGGTNSSLNFPYGTTLESVELRVGGELTVILGPAPETARDTLYTVIYAEIALAERGHRICAIKSYRERTGLGLKDSKDAIDRAVPHRPENSSAKAYLEARGESLTVRRSSCGFQHTQYGPACIKDEGHLGIHSSDY